MKFLLLKDLILLKGAGALESAAIHRHIEGGYTVEFYAGGDFIGYRSHRGEGFRVFKNIDSAANAVASVGFGDAVIRGLKSNTI